MLQNVLRRPLLIAMLVAGVLVLAAAAASGRPAASPAPQPAWATINVCRAPRLGLRGQMPGDGTREFMYMRFQAQYRSPGGWRAIGGRGTSPWLYAGSALFRDEQDGFTFSLAPPAAGSAYVLRGVVSFEWRSGSRVVRSGYAVTAAGHRGTVGADPRGYSASVCRLGG